MQPTPDQLLVEARARGRRWGEYHYRKVKGATDVFPSMLDRTTNRQAHDRVADIASLDTFGDALVEARYCAARDAFNALITAGDGCPVGKR